MELNNLSKKDLIKLKKDIDEILKVIDVRKIKSNKTSLRDLKVGDKILGIRLTLGGHSLKEPSFLDGSVDIIDYCNISALNIGENSARLGISHPDRPFGITTTIDLDQLDDHCYLNVNLFKSGYDGFYTLKPETWKQDITRLLEESINRSRKNFEEDLNLLRAKVNLFIQAEEKINQYI